MPWFVIVYFVIAILVMFAAYIAGVAFVADDGEIGVVILLGTTIIPVASAAVGATWPLALFALIIYGVVNRR